MRTITTVTWSIRREDALGQLLPEEQITLPPSYATIEEEVNSSRDIPGKPTDQIHTELESNQDEGESS